MKRLELSEDERRTLRQIGLSLAFADADADSRDFMAESGAYITADC